MFPPLNTDSLELLREVAGHRDGRGCIEMILPEWRRGANACSFEAPELAQTS